MVDLDKLKVGCVILSLEESPGYYKNNHYYIVSKKTKGKFHFSTAIGTEVGTSRLKWFKQLTDEPWWTYLTTGDKIKAIRGTKFYTSRADRYVVTVVNKQYRINFGGETWIIDPNEFNPDRFMPLIERSRAYASIKSNKRYSIW